MPALGQGPLAPISHTMTLHPLFSRAVLLAFACALCPSLQAAEPAISSHFNQRSTVSFTEPYRGTTRAGDDFERVVIDQLNAAQVSIDLANTALSLPHLGQALAAARQRGVRVRVILDDAYHRNWATLTPDEVASLSDEDQSYWAEVDNLVDVNHDGDISEDELATRDIPTLLALNGIPVIDDKEDGSQGSGIMHHKFVVLDGQRVIVTSANFTHSGFYGDIGTPGSRGNHENLLVLDSPALAALYAEEFAIMWGDGPGGLPDSRFGLNKPYRPARLASVGTAQVLVQFGPTSARQPLSTSLAGTVMQQLATATRSVRLGMYVFTDQDITDALRDLTRQKGLLVEALFDTTFASNVYNASLDMWGLRQLDASCQPQPYSHPWTQRPQAVGTPVLMSGDKLHHKFAVLDDQKVLTGSYNWTASGLRTNDENLLVIFSAVVASDYLTEMNRLKQGATYGPSTALRTQIQADLTRCAQ